ncbi:MAG: glycoside hydrolase family 15 protein [Euryarchaeota archaeon]|nr:glycoside hydrolase family 15 protein [Euryarchaeota archaeon]
MFGAIGNGETCALVSYFGSIDWLCIPRFDSPTVFARALDYEQGGSLGLAVVEGERVTPLPRGTPRYVPGTCILETAFAVAGHRLRTTDWMTYGARRLWRVISLTSPTGPLTLRVALDPRPHYNGKRPRVAWMRQGCVVESPGQCLRLSAPEAQVHDGHLEWSLSGPRAVPLLLTYGEDRESAERAALRATDHAADYRRTLEFWQGWAAQADPLFRARGRVRDIYLRSLLILRLLIYEPTGAMVAAPTTSLPEVVGGDANWDYRFCWVRDTALASEAFAEAGYAEEARRILEFLLGLTAPRGKPYPHPLVAVDGSLQGTREREVRTLTGFGNSRPVRVGNGAVDQKQNDLEGEVVAAILTYVEAAGDREFLSRHYPKVRRLVDHAARAWRETDSGIWEFRGLRRHYVHSKALCAAALHAGARLARLQGEPGDAERWSREARRVGAQLLRRGYSPRRRSFVRAYDDLALDASVLAIPLLGLLPPNHPRVQATLDTLSNRLGSGGLLRRFEEEQGAFLLASLWFAQVIALQDSPRRAHRVVEHAMAFAGNELGLFAEEFDVYHNRLLGNLPQAFSHLEFVRTALRLWGSKAVAGDNKH